MKELEQIIIASCFGEDRFEEIRFLEPNDFNDYHDKPFRTIFKVAKDVDGYENKLMKAIMVLKDNPYMVECLKHTTFYPPSNHLHYSALQLLELRFKSLFAELLSRLSIDASNEVERKILEEAYIESGRQDIFDLSDGILDYLGVHASTETKKRINAFIEYRDNRVKEARKVINGTK